MYTYFVSSVDRVVDGDTVDVIIDLGFDLTKKERVRLAGIDTPESRTRDLEEKAMGLEAKDHLTGMLEGADRLIVRTEKDGKYGRMLGWFYKNEESKYSINQIMIEQGYAWEYDGGKKEKDLQVLRDKRKVPDE
jgi:micrococcal nuclease